MTGYQIAFLVGLAILVLLKIDRELTRRKLRALVTEERNRRWYPTMQAIARNTHGKHSLH